MNLRALLVSKDSQAAAILNSVLSIFGVGAVSCEDAQAVSLLREQKFDAVIVDFDHPNSAEAVLQCVQECLSSEQALTVALLSDRAQLRTSLRKGANFVLYKPLSAKSAEAVLSAAAALMKRQRRSSRVPVQAPVHLKLRSGQEVEGILLDLSENGMHILAAQSLNVSVAITAQFSLPDNAAELEAQGEVTWTNPNGELGVRFVDPTDDLQTTVKDWITARAPAAPPQTVDPLPACKLTDLSAGGCYLETEAPFPENSLLSICFKAAELEQQADAIVRVMHPGFGMGLEFVSKSPDDPQQRVRLIELLASQPGVAPEVSIIPRALRVETAPASDYQKVTDSDDLLVNLLQNKSGLSQEEFLREMHNQRGVQPAVPA